MTEPSIKGTISFVNYEKQYATIEYKQAAKKKSVSFKFGKTEKGKVTTSKQTAKSHYFRVGDEVTFTTVMTDRGDKMTAKEVKFLYNTTLEVLINKARTNNQFLGYLKEANEMLFVKEINSYLFFPLDLSPWENWPDPKYFNEQVTFSLLHIDNIKKLAAELDSPEFIPEYKKLLYHFNRKEPVEAIVERVTPFAIYLDLGKGKVQAKLTISENDEKGTTKAVPGDKLGVEITYIGKHKISVRLAK